MREKHNWDKQVDVLVVGTGFAGLSAAIEAGEAGKKVLVIEKMKAAGGNSIISDGGIAAPGTLLQEEHRIEDSQQLMYEDMLKAGLGLNHPNLLATFVTNAGDAFQWTVDYLNVPYMDRVDLFGGHSVPRCYTPEGITGNTILKRMIRKVEELEIPILYNTCFRRFIRYEEGRVIGCVEDSEFDHKSDTGVSSYIKTSKGIVIASGGYGADVKFRSIQDPRIDDSIQTTNKPFATAEVLKSALAIGAASVHLSHIQLGAWASPDEPGFGHGPMFADYIVFKDGVIIDPKSGRRIVNELGDRKLVADAILAAGNPCVGIADHRAVTESGWDISKAINKGVVKVFDRMDELAHFYGMDIESLSESIKRYNNSVNKGNDEDFGKPIFQDAKEIESSPYYGMRLWPKVHFTMGGLRINEKAQVMDFEGNVIKGLYAAGEVAGGVHGASRLASCAITECIVFGRIAGQNI
jgi:flavocytochrome c